MLAEELICLYMNSRSLALARLDLAQGTRKGVTR